MELFFIVLGYYFMFVTEFPDENFFGSYLKFLRKSLKLSQQEASVTLNLFNEELAHVDVVAVSRWERGVILPNTRRQVKILRTFTNDISPYITLLAKNDHIHITESEMESFINLRYNSPIALITNAGYSEKYEHPSIESEIKADDKDVITEIFNFHHRLFPELTCNLELINAIEYIKDNRAIGLKYTQDNTLAGHKIGLFFGKGVLEKEINRLLNHDLSINDINLKLSKPINTKEPFSYYAISQYSNDESTMRSQLYTEFSMLVKNTNIHHYYCNVIFENAMEFMLKLGFNIIKVEDKNPNGAITFKGEKYDRALLHICTCNLLLNPEFIYMFTRCGTCLNRKCSSCPLWES